MGFKLGTERGNYAVNGEIHPRKNGKIFYQDKWTPEGSKDFPWEKMPWE